MLVFFSCRVLAIIASCIIGFYSSWYLCYPYYRQIRYWFSVNITHRDKKYKSVPLVNYCYPLVGHGISFSEDIIGFIKKSYKEYGPVFRIQIFRSELLVICDRTLIDQYFKADETSFSLYDALRRIYFGEAFSDSSDALETIIHLVKGTIRVNYEVFTKKIVEEAKCMVNRLRERIDVEDRFEMKDELIRFVARTSAKCFVCIDLSEEFFDVLMQFTDLLNKLVVLTYFLPRSVIHFLLGHKLDNLRHKMTDYLDETIEEYRKNPEKNDSLVIRRSVDFYKSGKRLTNAEIGDIIVCLLYVSSENTALGLNNCIIDLVQNPVYIDEVRRLTRKLIEADDFKAIFADKLLDACIMESARLNTHIFPLNRRSKFRDATLGDYFIGDIECVAICEPMLMKDEDCAADCFSNPNLYNPRRFIDGNEKKDSRNVMTWGSGQHLCPGKNFAIMEIKTAITLLLNTFEIEAHEIGKLDYFSPSAYADRSFSASLRLLPDPIDLSPNHTYNSSSTNLRTTAIMNTDMVFLEKEVKVEMIESAYIIRDALSSEKQRKLYEKTIASSPSSLIQKLESNLVPDQTAWPIAWENLIYTGTTTSELPFWKEIGYETMSLLNSYIKKHITGISYFELKNLLPSEFQADSVYVQLYGKRGEMKVHKDQYVDWGVSVSLGASCRFKFGDNELILHSGDILVCDFSKTDHAVIEILDDVIPSWFNPEIEGSVNTFGRSRCSIQIRDISKCPRPKKILSNQEFLEMLL